MHPARSTFLRAALAAVTATLAIGAPSAAASTTVGLPVEALVGGNKNRCVAMIECTYYQGGFPVAVSPLYTVPADGMIVRWRLGDGGSSNSVRLRVLRPVENKLVGAGTGPTLAAVSGVNVFENERLPVKAGDTIGLDNEDSALVFEEVFEITRVEYFMPYLPDGGGPASPNGEFSAARLEVDADVVGLPTSSGVAAACPGGSPSTVTVTSDPDFTDRAKAVRFRVDGGPEQVTPTTAANPGTASVVVPSGVHTLEFWGEDLLGQQEAAHHQLRAGCAVASPPAQGGSPGGGAATAGSTPVISSARQSASRWRAGNLLARISDAAARPAALPVGTTFSFNLSQAARAGLTFTQSVAGRKVGRTCIAPSVLNRGRPKCTRTLVRGALSFTAHTGTNEVRFQGRISRTRKLKPGRYTLVIAATNSAGQRSTPVHLSFTIVGN